MRRDDDDWIEDDSARKPLRRRDTHRSRIIAAVIGAVAIVSVPFIAYLLSSRDVAPPPPPPSAPAVDFVILKPNDGGAVGLKETVRGRTPHVGVKHYVVVTPVQIGQPYIQRKANVSDQGTWAGTAQFGEGRVGFDEEFIVYAIATNEELRPGRLTRSINVLGESPHITVRRTKN